MPIRISEINRAPLNSPTFTGTPTAPTQTQGDGSTKIATTAYIDTAVSNVIAGLTPSLRVAAISAAILPNTPTYLNGISGVGATLTSSSNAVLIVDGYTPTLVGERILVKNQAAGLQNGLYYVSQLGTGLLPWILTRSLDYDQPSEINASGAFEAVNGTINADTSWLLSSTITTVGTDSLTYVSFTLNPTTIEQNTNKDISGGYVGLTLFKINMRNAANTFTSFLRNSATAARDWLFPDYDGTVSIQAKWTDITSATTTDIGAANGSYGDVTGTTTITALGTASAGIKRTVTFTGILTLTHNATSLILPGGSNIITAVGDVAEFVSLASGNWKCTSYTPYNTTYTDWIPTITGCSVNPTGITARYFTIGKMCTCYFTYTGNGTSNSTSKTITLPFAAANTGVQIFAIRITDNGTIQAAAGILATRINSNIVDIGKTLVGFATWTASGGCGFPFCITYEMA